MILAAEPFVSHKSIMEKELHIKQVSKQQPTSKNNKKNSLNIGSWDKELQVSL